VRLAIEEIQQLP